MKSPARPSSAALLVLVRFLILLACAAPALRAQVPLATALDTTSLTWTTSDAPHAWVGQSAVSRDGVDAAKAATLQSHEAESWVQTTVNGPGVLSWHWRLDLGPERASTLEVLVGDDTIPQQILYENTAWTAASAAITEAGPVVVRWRFFRALEANNATAETAYLDSVAFAPFGPVVLQSATAINARGFTARWAALPNAIDYALQIATTADFSDATTTEPVAAPATSFVATGLEPLTTYHYRVVAFGPDLLEAVSPPATVTLLAIQRPANDAFASPSALSGISGSANSTTLDATVETDEPFEHQASVWFTWTSPGAGRWKFTATPANDGFAPAIRFYTGASLAALTEIADDDGTGTVEFDTAANVPYRIALDAFGGDAGAFTLAWQRLATHTAPANDAFANSIALAGASGSTTGSNLLATNEANEPAATGARTIWWRWNATTTGLATFGTAGSSIRVALSAWTGPSLAALTPVGASEQSLSVPVVAGTTYFLAVGGVNGAQGAINLQWSVIAATTSQTITFDPIPDQGVGATPFEVFARSSSALPVTIRRISGPATVEDNIVTLTGATGTVTLEASQAGNGAYLPATPVTRTFTVRPAPANDNFAAAIALTGASGSITGTNLGAGAQESEPFPGNRSVWWRWTATANGVLTLDTAGSAINTTLAVVTGATIDDLDAVADFTAAGQRAKVSFPVVSGETYRIAVDSHEDQGAIVLAWSLAAPSRNQTIAFDALPDVGVSLSFIDLDAVSDSGLPVSFAIHTGTTSGVATIEGDRLSLTGKAGTVVVRATQAGDAYYLPAEPVNRTFTVRPAPANDHFAAAVTLSGASGSITGTNLGASAQEFEPFPGNNSVWWRWTATATGVLTLDTAGSAISTTLAVVTGASLEDYDLVADFSGAGQRAKVSFPVLKGETYRIAVDSYENEGAISLAWNLAPPSRAQTIVFDPLPDVGVDAQSLYLDAYSDSGLPVSVAIHTGTTSGVVTLEDGLLAFTGKPGTVVLHATQAGDAYYMAATPVTVTFAVRPPPANDAFDKAVVLSGAKGAISGANVDATAESFDPFPATRSVWWRWTATATGVLTLDTAGSAIPATLAVLTGDPDAGLVSVAFADSLTRPARVEFAVTKGEVYRIAVDSPEAQGAIALAWNLALPSQAQTITFDPPDNVVAGDLDFELNVSASSGLPVELTISGPATLDDHWVRLTGATGQVTIRANQPGDAYFTAAPTVTRTFNVTKSPVFKFTFAADDLRKTYNGGEHPVFVTVSPDPRVTPLVVTYSGPGYPESEDAPTNAGTYTVTASADDSKQTAKLVIAKAPLTVTALDQSKFIGAPLPEFELSYAGFFGTDDADSLTSKPVATTTARANSPGGTYPIRVSGGQSTNYDFRYVPGSLVVGTIAGRYETLLDNPDNGLPAGKLTLVIAASGTSYTGVLTLPHEPAAFSIKGKLQIDPITGTANSELSVKRGANTYALSLAVPHQTAFSASLRRNGVLIGSTTAGEPVFVLAKGQKITWNGAHTALFLDPEPVSESDLRAYPRGAGHATAAIDAKGNLKLAGRLADGTKLTATLAPGQDRAYRLFVLAYGKRLHSHVSGLLPLADHPTLSGRRYLPAGATSLFWQKAALPSTTKASARDKSYRDGFGPLLLEATLDPWLPPAAKKGANPAITLAQRLGLAANNTASGAVGIDFGPDSLDFGALGVSLPTDLALNAKNAVSVAAPVTTPANATKFTLKITPATGAFTGSFTLVDLIPAPTAKNPDATKRQTRKVAFTGVLRQPPTSEDTLAIGAGTFLLVPLSSTGSTESVSGLLQLRAVAAP